MPLRGRKSFVAVWLAIALISISGCSGDRSIPSPPTEDTTPAATVTPVPKKVYLARTHPLTRNNPVQMTRGHCALPTWGTESHQLKRYFRSLSRCLDRSWKPIMTQLNLPWHRPHLKFPQTTTFTTACGGERERGPVYCRTDLYMPRQYIISDPLASPGAYIAVFAHEYGHHIQQISGILETAEDDIHDYGAESAKGLEMSRRVELQAQCFAGIFVSRNSGKDSGITAEMARDAESDIMRLSYESTDLNDHGTNKSNARWYHKGASVGRPAECATFTADRSDVR